MKILKEYIRQLIRESSDDEDYLAAVVWLEGPRRNAVIYDTRMLERVPKLLHRIEKDWNGLRQSLCDNVIKGMIDVGPAGGGACNGAWMVYRSAGPQSGKMVYSVGYALSPTGRLMSDRLSVSDSASGAWKKVYGKPEYKKLSLDDEDAHDPDGTVKYDHPHHTDDTSDDCAMYRGKDGSEPPEKYPHLQYAYEGTGEEQALLSMFRLNNENILKELFPGREEEVEGLLRSCGGLFFSRNYNH